MSDAGPSPTPEPSAGHFAHLDGLRALLAIFVVMAHCHPTIWPVWGPQPVGTVALLTHWLDFGYLPVEVFIVLSGFCLMLPVARNGGRMRGFAGTFYVHRARRILPTFYAALAVCLLLILGPLGKPTGTHWDYCLPVSGEAVVVNLLMLQDLFDQYKINHAFWSISIEWRLYFLFPILVGLFRRLGPWIVATVAAPAAMLVAVQLPSDGPWWGIKKTVSFLALFVTGMLAGSRPHWDPRGARLAALLATVVAVWQHSSWPCPQMLRLTTVQEFGTGIAAASWMAVWSTPGLSLTRRVLQWRPLPAIGITAYSLYLIHPPVVQLVWQYIVHPLGWTGIGSLVLLLVTAVPASILAAFGFHTIAERPFMSRRQKIAAATESLVPQRAE